MFLGIFSGIEVLFFILGALFVLGSQGVWLFKQYYQAQIASLTLVIIGLGTVLFAVAWSVSSVLEGEPQAGSMGVVVILLPGLILSVFGWRLAMKQAEQPKGLAKAK